MKKYLSSAATAGFTMIELLVVIAIIGILSALLLSNFVGVRERGADVGIKNDVRQLKTALRLYYNDHQRYPESNGSGGMDGCVDGEQTCALGGEFADGSSVYMSELPSEFSYYAPLGGDEFLIRVTLANASDGDIAASQATCDLSAPYYSDTTTELDYFVCSD